ncbi:MAG TPA: NADH-quinone oxidoreductase subunit I [Candidatus Korarchaeota archaeon]|nr:NADH-quinone oxidoreductase subunit I [Candidatus Korarchaeota archaeon]
MSKRESTASRLAGHLEAILTGFKYLFAEPRMTVRYPEEVIELPEGYRGMIIYHKERCISCSLCAMICPADAIKMHLERPPESGGESAGKAKPKRHPGINYTRCIFCGFCVDVCPAGALEFSDIHDAVYEEFEAMIYPPSEFEKGPPKQEFPKPPKRLRPKMDERRGIRYEPLD